MRLFGAVYGAFATLASPYLRRMLRRRAAAGKEQPARLGERFGIAGLARPEGRLVWLHAASVGETLSLLPVIAALEGQAQVLLTTGTVTSAVMAAERLPEWALHQFAPLDVPGWVKRFLDHWRPDCAVFVESEIWPVMLGLLDARRIPRLLVNASMSARSAARWRRSGGLGRRLLGGFRAVHAQSARDAATLQSLGVRALEWGNLKFAAPLLPVDEAALKQMRQALGRSWLAASTHPGEEVVVVAAHRALLAEFPDLVTVIAPRHPERGAEIAALADAPRRSLGQPPAPGQVYVADTLGELGLFYRICPCAFVGGSLVPIGGHNLSEPARLGAAVLVGPHTREITEQVERLLAAGAALQVADAASLAEAVRHWLRDPLAAAAAGAKGLQAFDGLRELAPRLAKLILDNCK